MIGPQWEVEVLNPLELTFRLLLGGHGGKIIHSRLLGSA